MERKIIETEIWEENPEKKGFLKFVDTRKVYDVFKELEENMEKAGMMPDEYFLLSHRFDKNDKMPRDASITTKVRWGSNEGVYIDVDITAFEGGTVHFATGKTLGETEEDYDKMCAIAGFIYKSFAGFGRVISEPAEENKEENTYVVCIDESFLRDTQLFDSKSLSDDEFIESGNGLNVENCWVDAGFNAFVDIVKAETAEKAVEKAAEKHGYDKRTMFAIDVSKRG